MTIRVTRVSSWRVTYLSHVLLFFICVFETVPFLWFVVGWSFLFFVASSLAVFHTASAFNQDVSKWNTGAVTTMRESKCKLFLPFSVATLSAVVSFEYTCTTTRISSDHNSHTFCNFVFVCLNRYVFCDCGGGLVFPFLCCTLSCSVLFRICVQSGRVQMEYGGGDNYGTQ